MRIQFTKQDIPVVEALADKLEYYEDENVVNLWYTLRKAIRFSGGQHQDFVVSVVGARCKCGKIVWGVNPCRDVPDSRGWCGCG
jgi:hypothetical protein